jgi:phospholipase C
MHEDMLLLRVAAILTLLARLADAQPAHCPFDAGALPTETNPGGLHGAQIPVDHVVVLMQENRSFDHYFNKLHGRLKAVERVPEGASNPDPQGGPPIRPFRSPSLCEVDDIDHSWNGTHRAWNGGAMDGFTAENVIPLDPSGARAMHYLTKKDLPFYYKLYSTFATSDRHFCSVLGPTFPNRHYLLAGTSFGHIRNDFPSSTAEFAQRTVFEQLDEAGVDWKIYQSDLAFGLLYSYVRELSANIVPVANFFADAAAGTLPAVAFIDPIFLGDEGNDEHPPRNPQLGQAFVASVVQAMFASPQWPRSALFVLYDEHGGYWDHVPPPPACVPDDVPPLLQPGDVVADFDRYGIRVPLVVVSPFARRKHVSHVVTDQTSVLRFIQTRFDLAALTRRDANADPLLGMFDFAAPPFLQPPRLPKAKLDTKRTVGCQGSASGAFLR